MLIKLFSLHFFIAIATPHTRARFLVCPPLCVKCVNAGFSSRACASVILYMVRVSTLCANMCAWCRPGHKNGSLALVMVNCAYFTNRGRRDLSQIYSSHPYGRCLAILSSPTSHSHFSTALAVRSLLSLVERIC